LFTLAHLSDPHVGPLPAAGKTALLNKRLLGYLSWKRRRQKAHRTEVLDAMLDDLAVMAPNHIALTGDLANISLPGEFPLGAAWLARLGDPQRVSFVPGNHDAYVAMPWETSWRLWRDYMAGDPDTAVAAHRGFQDFPYLRRRDGLALIGLSSALPTPPGFASGRLGPAQLERLAALLDSTAREGLCRIVLLHHPPVGAVAWRKRLTDADAFRRVLAAQGAELVLHGHDHTTTYETLPGRDGPVPVFGIASASQAIAGKRPAAQYRLFLIVPSPRGWQLDIALRAYDPATGRFNEVAVETLDLPRACRQKRAL